MLPLQLVGFALAGKTLLTKYNRAPDRYSLPNKTKIQFKLHPRKIHITSKTTTMGNPIQTLASGLTSTLSQITTKLTGEDYNSIVKDARKVKQIPYSPSNWYNLANALVEAGAHRDALIAIEVGMDLDLNSVFKEKFLALRNKITIK